MADATQYKATVAWRTLARKVVQLTKATESTLATYRVYVSPSDRHDVGAGTVESGFYFISYIGNPYLIIATGTGYIDVEDSFRFRRCPTSGKNGIVYKSVGDGDSPYLAPFFRFLHPTAFEKFMGIALDILWTKDQRPVFNGGTSIPTLTDNGDGTVTVGVGAYNLALTTDGSKSKTFSISGATFTLTNLQQNYIVANYNSGNPILQHITDVTLINETTIIPIFSIFRNGTNIHVQNWDSLGLSLANKVHQSIVKTQRYRRDISIGGLTLSEYGTRNLRLTAGRVWVGAVPVDLSLVETATDNLFFWHHSSGNWTVSVQTQYDNAHYDNGTDLIALTTNKYAVNWIFRGVESQKHLYVVVGTGDYNLNQAQAATIPAIPVAISSHSILVGKLIVQQGASSALSIQSAFDTQFSPTPLSSHSDLTNLGWTSSGHTGTANCQAYFNSSGEASFINNSIQALSGTTVAWNANNGIHATITLSGNTTITLSNLVAGTSGNLSVTNPASLYTLTVSGYTNKISPSAYLASNQLKVSGSSKLDIFSWYYDGTNLWWNGSQDYK